MPCRHYQQDSYLFSFVTGFRRPRQSSRLLVRRRILPHLDPRATVFFQIRAGDRHRTDLRVLRDLEHDIEHEFLDDRPERSRTGVFFERLLCDPFQGIIVKV